MPRMRLPVNEEGVTRFIDQDSLGAGPIAGPGHRAGIDEVSFRIGKVEFSCNGQPLTDRRRAQDRAVPVLLRQR